MRMAIKLLFIAILLAAPITAAAQQAGTLVRPAGELSVRSEPPGFFRAQGRIVATVKPSDTLRILEKRSIPGVTGTAVWLRIEGAAPNSNLRGWIFSGTSAQPLANVKPAN